VPADDLYRFDQEYRSRGPAILAGVDEAGRGCWAGPLVAAAVILKTGPVLAGLNDSKQLTALQRERLFGLIIEQSEAYAVSVISPAVVDEVNVLQATFIGMRNALAGLSVRPSLALIDGNRGIPAYAGPQKTVIRGDALSASIAAASILAKVTRDRIMHEEHPKYPVYSFDQNKGYGTASHRDALNRYGPCDIHRRSYAPVKECLLSGSRPAVPA